MLELNKVYCGDCLELMKQISDKSIDLILTDPPYGINWGKEPKSMSAGIRKDGSQKYDKTWSNPRVKKYKTWNDTKPTKEYFDEIFRISKNQIIWGGNYFELPLTGGWLVWDKKVVLPTGSKCEFAWTSFLGHSEIIHYLWAGYRKELPEDREHTTQKPLEIMKWCLKFLPEAQIILDPFAGAGTTLVACKQFNKSFIGIEIEKEFVEICNQRLRQNILI